MATKRKQAAKPKAGHCHKHECKHAHVSFCADCNKVYCADCNEEWVRNATTWMNQSPWRISYTEKGQTIPCINGGYDSAGTLASPTYGGGYAHTTAPACTH